MLPTGEHLPQLCPPDCSEQHHQHAAMRILGPKGERIDIVHDLQARHQLFDLHGISHLPPVQMEVRLRFGERVSQLSDFEFLNYVPFRQAKASANVMIHPWAQTMLSIPLTLQRSWVLLEPLDAVSDVHVMSQVVQASRLSRPRKQRRCILSKA